MAKEKVKKMGVTRKSDFDYLPDNYTTWNAGSYANKGRKIERTPSLDDYDGVADPEDR